MPRSGHQMPRAGQNVGYITLESVQLKMKSGISAVWKRHQASRRRLIDL